MLKEVLEVRHDGTRLVALIAAVGALIGVVLMVISSLTV
ncbi:hypothetical protein B0G82_3589 [Paraburkholderia sp. BL17N1]|nr:hypothetical protein B0G82_3589 [Paraburkholderia sp. BL17N1]